MASVQFNMPWYTTRRFRVIALYVLVALTVGEGVVAICLKDNDFLWHRNLGKAFSAGKPYANGGQHYLPARTMFNAATAWLPYRADRTLVYALALGALAWTMRKWRGLAGGRQPLADSLAFATAVLTLVVCGAYLQRDLDDCGLQILLLFLLTAALASLHAGKRMWCGWWLALATAYKLTPFLFLPYLCYKRQWRAAAWMAVFLGVLCLAPALWLGWETNWQAHKQWWEETRTALSLTDPSENGIEPPNPRNQSLTLALARLVQTYPPGHPLYLDNPFFLQLGDLDPATAKRIIQGILLALAAILAWRFRAKAPQDSGSLLHEWAIVMLLAAILSPMCWLQHLVLVLPAVYLVARANFEGVRLSRAQRVVFWIAAAIMIFAGQRDLLGQQLFLLAMSYKVHTWAVLTVLALVLTLRKPLFSSRDRNGGAGTEACKRLFSRHGGGFPDGPKSIPADGGRYNGLA